jgi:hypothetical protein
VIQTITEALSKTLLEVAGAKVLLAVGAFATFVALGQHDEAALVILTFLGVGGVRAVAETITAGKTETAVAEATTAVASAPTSVAETAAAVAVTLTPTPTPEDSSSLE